MATRQRKVEYPLTQLTTSLAAATRHEFASETLTIEETSSRTFRSVFIHVRAQDNSPTGVNVTSCLLGIKLGAAAFDDVTQTTTISGTGDGYAMEWTRDVTSYFTTNFGSGATQTAQVAVQFGAVPTINITAKLVITYDFDDSSQTTRTKTVKIPLESSTGDLSQTLTEIGTNQVPDLDSFLPEASKSYKSIWFEVLGNSGTDGTTDSALELSLDAEAGVAMGTEENATAEGRWSRHIWRRNDMTTNATHQFKARTTNAHLDYATVGVVLCVTYSYDHANSTTIINSLEMPIGYGDVAGHYQAADSSRMALAFYVEEPTTITLVQSAVQVTAMANSDGTYNIKAGGQSTRAYSIAFGSNSGGPVGVMHRIDSGGAQGSGLTIARGKNTLTVDVYTGGEFNIFQSHLCGLVHLNYTSGKHASGDGVHAQTRALHIGAMGPPGATHTQRNRWTAAPAIPETNFYLNAVGILFSHPQGGSAYGFNVLMSQVTGDPAGVHSWVNIWSGPIWSDYAMTWTHMAIDVSHRFRRYPTQMNAAAKGLLDIEQSRRYQLTAAAQGRGNVWMLYTYHAITFTESGTVSDYSGAGTDIPVVVHNSATHEPVCTVNTTAGGAYTATVYDNTVDYYSTARESNTHCGRSANGAAT